MCIQSSCTIVYNLAVDRDAGPYNVQTDARGKGMCFGPSRRRSLQTADGCAVEKPPLCKGRGTAIAVEGLFGGESTFFGTTPPPHIRSAPPLTQGRQCADGRSGAEIE